MNRYDFETGLKRNGLSAMKWEYETDRTGYSDLLSFGTADMDFASPRPVLDALRDILDHGHLGYPYPRASYYESIENWLKMLCGWSIDAKACVSNHVGIYTSVWNVISALTDPGDEIIIQTPAHFCFTAMVKDNNRVVVENPLRCVNGRYEMDYEHLEKCFSEKTKLFWLNNPHNPVGRAWTREELSRLGEICLRHGVLILSDDVYCGLLYPGTTYTPIAALSPELANHTVTCYSTSKTYNTTGIKFSFVVIENPELMAKYDYALHQLDLNYGINAFGLAATEAAFNRCEQWRLSLMEYIAQNKLFLDAYLKEHLPSVPVCQADSTYFAWLDIRALSTSSDEVAGRLEKEAHIIVESGAHLGTGGNGYIRWNLACPLDTLHEGLARFASLYQ